MINGLKKDSNIFFNNFFQKRYIRIISKNYYLDVHNPLKLIIIFNICEFIIILYNILSSIK